MMSNWQSSLKDVKHRSVRLFETMKFSDCSFVVGLETNPTVFAAHKLVLSTASPVFEIMFYGSLAENAYPIVIPDIEPRAFRALLEYIYTDRISVETFESAAKLCYAAQKYMLPQIVDRCIEFLTFNLNPTNACRCYELAKLFDKENLKEISLQLIMDRTEEVLDDPGFIDIEMSTLLDILNMDLLNIKSELQLFAAIERYAKARISLATEFEDDVNDISHFREPLKKIRFLLMTPTEFSEGPANSHLLHKQEKSAILRNITNDYSPMPEGFSRSRCDRTYSMHYLSCNY